MTDLSRPFLDAYNDDPEGTTRLIKKAIKDATGFRIIEAEPTAWDSFGIRYRDSDGEEQEAEYGAVEQATIQEVIDGLLEAISANL